MTATLEEYCEFDERRVYVLMAIARKKENDAITTNTEIVFREIVKNADDIARKLSRLRAQAEHYDAEEGPLTFRVYMTANARDSVSAFYNYKRRLDTWSEDLYNGDESALPKLKRTDRHFISELQRPENRAEKRFLWDLDGVTEAEAHTFTSQLPADWLYMASTPNGYHIVSEPFNWTTWAAPCEHELKTDGMMMVEVIEQ